MSSDRQVRKGINTLNLQYKANVAPVIGPTQYSELMKAYEETGKLPKRLEITGMVIDDSMNANHWSVPKEEMEEISKQMVGQQIRKDHSDSVDSVIGQINEAWVEDNKVWAKGEIADENLIQKILLGYVKYSSIQLLSEDVLCANCFMTNHKSEAEAKITDINNPCPVCGKYELVVKQPRFVEWSMVALPAYEKAEIQPLGFKAAVDKTLEVRFSANEQKQTETPPVTVSQEKFVPDPTPIIAGVTVLVAAGYKLLEELQANTNTPTATPFNTTEKYLKKSYKEQKFDLPFYKVKKVEEGDTSAASGELGGHTPLSYGDAEEATTGKAEEE